MVRVTYARACPPNAESKLAWNLEYAYARKGAQLLSKTRAPMNEASEKITFLYMKEIDEYLASITHIPIYMKPNVPFAEFLRCSKVSSFQTCHTNKKII